MMFAHRFSVPLAVEMVSLYEALAPQASHSARTNVTRCRLSTAASTSESHARVIMISLSGPRIHQVLLVLSACSVLFIHQILQLHEVYIYNK